METAEVLTDAGQCLTQARALVNAVRQLASRWEAAGDRAHAAELLSVASTAMSGVAAGDARHEVEGMAAVPDTAEPWAARLAGPHPPHISRVAGALLTWTSSRSQAYMVAYTLADAGLLGELATAAEPQCETVASVGADRDRLAAELAELHTWRGLMSLLDEHWPADVFDGSSDDGDPGPRIVFLMREIDCARARCDGADRRRRVDVVLEFGEGSMEYDGPVLDHYGCRWLPAVRPGDGFRGWVHRLPGSNLAPVWQTWGQLTIQRGPLTAVDADRLDIPARCR